MGKTYTNTELSESEVKKYIDFLRANKEPYTLALSNFTTTLESEFLNVRFMKEEKSLTFFARSKELKKQVDLYLSLNNVGQVENVSYYDVKDCEDFISSKICNIDLSSAYLNVLYNNKVIDQILFDKLNLLSKPDRLGVVGMLASKKIKFFFDSDGNQYKEPESIENKEHRNIFFFCVLTTGIIMHEIKKMLGESYIFTWVDGIYFKKVSEKKLNEIKIFLEGINYPYKVEYLTNFELHKNGQNIEIDYLKENKEKSFSIPLEKNNKFAEEIYNYINK